MKTSAIPGHLTSRPAPTARARRQRACLETLEDRRLFSFTAAASYPVGVDPQAIATGDFNGDGRLDLVSLNAGSATISVLRGNADGTFQPAQRFATGSSPRSVAVGDFNRDGKLDLVTINSSDDLSMLLGKGDGSFAPTVTVPSGIVPAVYGAGPSMAVGDLNGDGKLDLVVNSKGLVTTYVDYQGNTYSTVEYASVLLGHGDGTFSSPTRYAIGGRDWDGIDAAPTFVTVADFNSDGKPDVATAGADGACVLLGDGNGALQPASQFVGVPAATSLAVGDANGDGKLDAVVTSAPVGMGVVSLVGVLPGNGDGTFRTGQNFAAGASESSVAIGDFNKDGKLDLVVANASGVSVLLGNGNGTFQPALTHVTGSDPSAVAVGDFNGDGFPDLAVANAGSNSVSVLINARDWLTTSQASSFVIRGFPSSMTAGVAGTFTVTATTTSGAKATDYAGTIHFTSSDGKASLPANYTFSAADAGIHTFRATLKTAGTQSITARDTVTGTITGTDGGIRVKPAAATELLISAPASVRSGVPFSLTVTVKDSYGNVTTGYTGTMQLKCTAGTASLAPNHTFTAADKGVHTFTGLVLRKRGNQRITATDTRNSWLTGNVIVDVL